MSNNARSLLLIHISVMLLGMSGLFGKLVELPAVIIVLGRVFFSLCFLFVVIKIKKYSIKLATINEYILIIIAGIIISIHWTAFMQSVQISTVAVATLTFATYPLIVTFIEPVIFREKLKLISVISAIIMILGVFVIVPSYEPGNEITKGVIWGMISSLAFGIVSMINRKFSNKYVSEVISFYEQGVATLVLLPAFFLIRPQITIKDTLAVIVLGVVFTAIAHTLFIRGLKYVKVQTAGIISGLESAYGIIFALLILREVPSIRELIGGVIILSVVFYTTVASEK